MVRRNSAFHFYCSVPSTRFPLHWFLTWIWLYRYNQYYSQPLHGLHTWYNTYNTSNLCISQTTSNIQWVKPVCLLMHSSVVYKRIHLLLLSWFVRRNQSSRSPLLQRTPSISTSLIQIFQLQNLLLKSISLHCNCITKFLINNPLQCQFYAGTSWLYDPLSSNIVIGFSKRIHQILIEFNF